MKRRIGFLASGMIIASLACTTGCGLSEADVEATLTQGADDMVATLTAQPTDTLLPTDTPTATPEPTATPTDTPTPRPTATPTSSPTPTPSATPTRRPTAVPSTPTTAGATSEPQKPEPAATATQAAPPPMGSTYNTFLADARQTEQDLLVVKGWFDQAAAGYPVYCSDVAALEIHTPSSEAPAQVPELAPFWGEYMQALADGIGLHYWLVQFCINGGGDLGTAAFVERRGLASDALSHCEHVVQGLEALQ